MADEKTPVLQYYISKKGLDLFNDIKGGVNDIYNKVRQDKTLGNKLDKVESELSSCIKNMLNGGTSSDQFFNAYISFLTKSSLLAYLQKFDNDRDINELRKQYSSSDEEIKALYVKDLTEEYLKRGESVPSDINDREVPKEVREKYSSLKIDTDFRFGFQGLAEMVTATVEVLKCRSQKEKVVSGALSANLLSAIREDVTPEQYLTGGYIEKDIQLIALFGDPPMYNLFTEMLDYIKSDNNYMSLYNSALYSILGVYKYLLQDSFGLRPYEGVVSLKGQCCKVITKSYRLGRREGSETVFKDIATKLSSIYKVNEVSSRQFKVKKIIESNSDVPMYFANKLLEYAMGRQLTYRLSEAVYRQYENVNSWESYSDAYVEPQISQLLFETIYYSLERHYEFKDKDNKEFMSESFKKDWVNNSISIKEVLSSADMKVKVDKDLQKVMKSLCCGCVVVAYNNLGGTVNSIALRIVDVNNELSLSNTKYLFDGCTASPNIQYSDGDNITEGKTGRAGIPIPYPIIEYRHDFNATLSQAEPLFGYTAVNMFIERNKKISWNNILLGEDIKGTPLFASLDNRDDIPLQKNAVHNMMAGSRSGKGVMTMNILGSAVAEDKPIFYTDRKPDMSVMFTEISNGRMYCVNGGQYLAEHDPRGVYSDKGVGTSGWEEAYNSMPPYLKAKFNKKSYSGDFGDYVYFRSVLFSLSLIVARVEFGGTEIYNKLGGSNGIVIVIDEFKNWQDKFESSFFSPTGVFGNSNRLQRTSRANFKKIKGEIRALEVELEAADLKEAKRAKLKTNLELKYEQLNEVADPLKVYCTQVMDKYGETIKNISEIQAAGFRDNEGRVSDIFVIGQHMETDGYDGSSTESGVYEQRDNGLFNANDNTKNKSLMRGIFNSFSHDWFMGFNDKYPDYTGASSGKAEKWIKDRKYWAYTQASMNTLRTTTPSDAIFFKPYLVLNRSDEDDPKHRRKIEVNGEYVDDPDYKFIAQCRDRVNDAVSGLWEKIRIKHLINDEMREDAISGRDKHYGCLNPGIGFQGLASLMRQSVGKGEFTPDCLALSGQIADFVAQKMGYSNYKELLFDFSPKGIFSSRDIINAIRDPKTYSNLQKRLPLFSDFGILGSNDSEYDFNNDTPDTSFRIEDEVVEAGSGNIARDEEPSNKDSNHRNISSNDGWTYVNQEDAYDNDSRYDNDSGYDIPEEMIYELCERVLTTEAQKQGKVIDKSIIREFYEEVIEALSR